MADAVLNFVKKLSNLAIEEASLFGQVKDQMKLLRDEMEWMYLFIRDADSQCSSNEKIKLLMEQMKNVTFDAEHVIDEFTFHMDRRELRLRALGFLKCLPTCVGFVDKLPFMHELDSRLKDITLRIERIMANRTKYGAGLESVMAPNSITEVVAHQQSWRPPIVEENDIVGVQDSTEVVTRLLMVGTAGRAVVSIVGMGGLGKTTLARKVYNHHNEKRQFDCHAWVYVSQEFNAKETLLAIAYCVMSLSDGGKEEMKEMGETDLGKKICKSLQGKKYLVVMDDVWCTEVWSSMRSYLPEANDGGKVLITTRNEEIALHAASQEEIARAFPNSEEEIAQRFNSQALIYRLRLLNFEESWQLLLKKTFGNRSTFGVLAPAPQLKASGKNIVKECRGLPLAILLVGGILSLKEKTQSSWVKVLAGIRWHSRQCPDSVMGIIAMGYNDLPYYLKSCFLYLGMFPEDLEIKKSKLIRSWLAEGFIERRGRQPLDDVAEDYLHELIQRGMIEVISSKVDGRVKSCRIHDLLRDFTISEARDRGLFHVFDVADVAVPIRIHRLALQQHDLIKSNISRYLSKSHLKSLFALTENFDRKSWGFLKGQIKLLNVLDLKSSEDNCIVPNVIGELTHLRFFRLRGSQRVTLLFSFENLVNLQSFDLDLNDAYISDSIWTLEKLKCLYCPCGTITSNGFKLRKLGKEKVSNLQVLELKAGGSLPDGDGLGKLTQLTKLRLLGRLNPHLKTRLFKCIANLTALQTLILSVYDSDGDDEKKTLLKCLRLKGWKKEMEENPLIPVLPPFSHHTNLCKLALGGKLELPDQIKFYPPNLLKLSLRQCELQSDPMLMLGKLPNLRHLELSFRALLERSCCALPEDSLDFKT